jgi:chaperonin GroES
MKPRHDYILIEPEKPQERSEGGIFLPEQSREKQQQGKVLAVGPGALDSGVRVPPDVSVGDTVLFSKYSGTDLEVDDRKLLLVHDHDVIAVVKQDKSGPSAEGLELAERAKREMARARRV